MKITIDLPDYIVAKIESAWVLLSLKQLENGLNLI